MRPDSISSKKATFASSRPPSGGREQVLTSFPGGSNTGVCRSLTEAALQPPHRPLVCRLLFGDRLSHLACSIRKITTRGIGVWAGASVPSARRVASRELSFTTVRHHLVALLVRLRKNEKVDGTLMQSPLHSGQRQRVAAIGTVRELVAPRPEPPPWEGLIQIDNRALTIPSLRKAASRSFDPNQLQSIPAFSILHDRSHRRASFAQLTFDYARDPSHTSGGPPKEERDANRDLEDRRRNRRRNTPNAARQNSKSWESTTAVAEAALSAKPAPKPRSLLKKRWSACRRTMTAAAQGASRDWRRSPWPT